MGRRLDSRLPQRSRVKCGVDEVTHVNPPAPTPTLRHDCIAAFRASTHNAGDRLGGSVPPGRFRSTMWPWGVHRVVCRQLVVAMGGN